MRFMTKTLELNYILEMISKYSKTETVQQEIISMIPSTNLQEIEKWLDETLDMTTLIARMGALPLIEDFDIEGLFNYGKVDRLYTISDLLYIRLFLVMERDVNRYIKEAYKQKIAFNTLEHYVQDLNNHESLLNYIQSKMDEDGQILDDATPELAHIRRDLSRLDKHLQDRLYKLLNDYTTYLNEHVIVIRNNRFCIPVKDAFKNKIKGIIHDVSSSQQTVYIEPEQTRQITAEIENLKVREEKEIQKIIALMSEEVFQASESLISNLNIFLSFDFIQSKALYARTIDGNRPFVNQEGTIHLIQAKHPLLDQKTAVPIELKLNDHMKTLLITGPNTGGKTVALKTVGLMTLMMQCGLLISASESSNLSIFNQVFADIGDEQSIQQSLSTFSSHLTKIIQMIEHVSDKTLILLDELGSGTDPNEGVSLAIAILNHFKSFDVSMMVTTHYSELKSYAYEQSKMATASVAFDKVSLKPLYYLQMGTTGSSHAFLIARRLGLQESVVSDAESIYKGRQTDLSKIMEKLNDEMMALEKQKEKLSEEIKLHTEAKDEFIKTKQNLIAAQDDIIEKIKVKELSKWDALKKEALKLIEDLKDKQSISNPEIAQFKYQLNQTIANDQPDFIVDELTVGDEVFIMPYQQYGKIKAIKDDRYRVVFGQFDLTFKASDLRKETTKKVTPKALRPKKVTESTVPEKKGSFELDLRGYRFEEVKDAMDHAIDSALLSGLQTLRIIHGFGSGAVRKAVHDYINKSPYIKSKRFGGEGEGLNGVTIITLK